MDNLVLNAILLRCEGERGSLGLIEFGIGSGVEGKPPIYNHRLYIPKGECSGIRRHVGIFSWSKEEEECNDDHIDGGLQAFSSCKEVLCNVRNTSYELDGDGIDAVGRGVLLLPSHKHAPNEKYSP